MTFDYTAAMRPWKGATLIVSGAMAFAIAACGDGSEAESGDTAQRSSAPAPSEPTQAARAALSAGRAACHDGRPGALFRSRLRAARRDANPAERRFLRAARRAVTSPRGPQVAARVYAMSLPRAQRVDAYAGCTFELEQSSSKSAAASGGPR